MRLKVIVSGVLAIFLATNAQALEFDSDVPKAVQTQMLEDLKFIREVRGSKQTPFHAQVFKALNGEKYSTFFNERIESVGLDSGDVGSAVAYVSPIFDPNKMWLTMNFVNFSHPQIARVMVVFHEARHTEAQSGFWSHDTCPTPFLDANGKPMTSIWTGAPLAGEAACDSKAFGSYGSSTIMLKNISKHCENCSEKIKMDAELYAADQLGRISKSSVKQSMLDDFNKLNATN